VPSQVETHCALSCFSPKPRNCHTRKSDAQKIKPQQESHRPVQVVPDRRGPGRSDALPWHSLEVALSVARVIHRRALGGRSASRNVIASALDISPGSPTAKRLIESAFAYGLVRRKGHRLALSATARNILASPDPALRRAEIIEALLVPATLRAFYSWHDGRPLPHPEHFSVILTTHFGVPQKRVNEVAKQILDNARFGGILRAGGPGEPPGIDLLMAEARIVSSDPPGGPQPPIVLRQNTARDCFFISPIGDDGTLVRQHADMILTHLVQPVLESLGFDVVRADHIRKPGVISKQVLEYIQRSPLCIADLSFANPNVYYELCYRELTGLPFVLLIRKGDRPAFDVAHKRILVIDTSNAYTIIECLTKARHELEAFVRQAIAPA
jgi:hypothetical protein